MIRDVADGLWAEPAGDTDSTLGEGMWALPGLVDAHSHIASAELNYQPGQLEGALERAGRALEAGVMLLLDKGWTDDVAVQAIDALSPDRRPDIEAAAKIIASVDGYFPGFAKEIDSSAVADEVATQAAAGRGWVKLIGDWPRKGVGPAANFDSAALEAAVAVAREAGSRVAIHTMAREVPSMAVAAGIDSIEHGLFLTPDDLGKLGERGGMWVPTVLRCEDTLAFLGENSSGGRLFAEGLENVKANLPIAVEAGVRVLAGTDLIGEPSDVAAEALRLGDYGLSPQAVLDSVSVSGLEATGRSADFAVGSPANAVLFEADPLVEPGVLAHPRTVVRLGRLV